MNIVINKIKCFRHKEEKLVYGTKIVRRAYFYYFTTKNDNPMALSKESFTNCYFNVRSMRIIPIESEGNQRINKRVIFQDQTTSVNNVPVTTGVIVLPPTTKRRKAFIQNQIGDWFSSYEAISLFNVCKDETVYDCLTRRIDLFEDVINSKQCVSSIVNRATEENCSLSLIQGFKIGQKIQYLRQAYLNVLSCADGHVNFQSCCADAIVTVSNNGHCEVSSRLLMKWNQIFRCNEIFPHPNVYIQMGKEYQPLFLEAFPEAKLAL